MVTNQQGIENKVDKTLRLVFQRKKEKSFFVEAGAFDGEYISNSLYFELKHQVELK